MNKFDIPKLGNTPKAPPNTPAIPMVRTRTIASLAQNSKISRNAKRPKSVLSTGVIQDKLNVLQQELSRTNSVVKSSSSFTAATSSVVKYEDEMWNPMPSFDETMEVTRKDTKKMKKWRNRLEEEEDGGGKVVDVVVLEKYKQLVSRCNVNDVDQMYRLVQSTLQVRRRFYSRRTQQQQQHPQQQRMMSRTGIFAPFRRVLVRDEYLRDGGDEMDVSFATTANGTVDDDQVMSSTLAVEPTSEIVVDCEGKNVDYHHDALALLVQRIHDQQILAVGKVGDDEDDAYNGNNDKENRVINEDLVEERRWSYEDAKELLLSDERVRGLGVTWIALAEMMNNFEDNSSKDDIIAIYDEGEEYVLGNPLQIKVLRNARNKYLKKHDISSLQRSSGVLKTPQRPSRGARFKPVCSTSTPAMPSSSCIRNTPSSVCSMQNFAPDSVVTKDHATIPSPKQIYINHEVKFKFEDIDEYKTTEDSDDQQNEGPFSPTGNIRQTMETTHISEDSETVLTPLRRSKRIASRSSEKKPKAIM